MTKPIAFKGTVSRREHLSIGKYFRCQCPRCLDPTELGTNFSSLGCRSCVAGLMAINDDEATAKSSSWTCNACGAQTSDETAQRRVDAARALATAAGFAVADLEQLLVQQTELLSPHHYLVVETKQRTAAVLRSLIADGRLTRAEEMHALLLKEKLCAEMLPVLRILKPGISRLTGKTLAPRGLCATSHGSFH